MVTYDVGNASLSLMTFPTTPLLAINVCINVRKRCQVRR